MIDRAEFDILMGGMVNQAARAIEDVEGRRLTRSETQALANIVHTGMQLLAARCFQAKAVPPLPPEPRSRKHAQLFNPVQTQEIRPVTDADINAAKAKR